MTGAIVYPAGYDYPVASAARYLLDAIVRVFDENEVELPARRVITIGSLAVDTPVLAVMFGGVAVGPPGNELNVPFRGESPRSITLNVELWRSTPAFESAGGAEPSAETVTATAEAAMNDSWLLLQAAYVSDQTGVGIVANVTPSAPQGERHGVSMIVEQQIP